MFVIAIGDEAKYTSSNVVNQLRKSGVKADQDYLDKKVKGQFKSADRVGATYAVIIGEEELANGVANVKNLKPETKKL